MRWDPFLSGCCFLVSDLGCDFCFQSPQWAWWFYSGEFRWLSWGWPDSLPGWVKVLIGWGVCRMWRDEGVEWLAHTQCSSARGLHSSSTFDCFHPRDRGGSAFLRRKGASLWDLRRRTNPTSDSDLQGVKVPERKKSLGEIAWECGEPIKMRRMRRCEMDGPSFLGVSHAQRSSDKPAMSHVTSLVFTGRVELESGNYYCAPVSVGGWKR